MKKLMLILELYLDEIAIFNLAEAQYPNFLRFTMQSAAPHRHDEP